MRPAGEKGISNGHPGGIGVEGVRGRYGLGHQLGGFPTYGGMEGQGDGLESKGLTLVDFGVD